MRPRAHAPTRSPSSHALTCSRGQGRPVGRNKRTHTGRQNEARTRTPQHDDHIHPHMGALNPLTRCKWSYGAWGMPSLAVGTDRAPPHTVSCSTFGWEGIRYSLSVDSATLQYGGRRPGQGEARSNGLSMCASHTLISETRVGIDDEGRHN